MHRISALWVHTRWEPLAYSTIHILAIWKQCQIIASSEIHVKLFHTCFILLMFHCLIFLHKRLLLICVLKWTTCFLYFMKFHMVLAFSMCLLLSCFTKILSVKSSVPSRQVVGNSCYYTSVSVHNLIDWIISISMTSCIPIYDSLYFLSDKNYFLIHLDSIICCLLAYVCRWMCKYCLLKICWNWCSCAVHI